jgi:hypothetical protein
MDHYERSKLADAIKEEKFTPDQYVIREVSDHINHEFRAKSETYFTLLWKEKLLQQRH